MDKEDLLGKWKLMSLIREFDLHVKDFSQSDEAFGYFHTSIGQEAVSVGVIPNINENDYLTSTYRNHSHGIARGLDIKRMYAEMLGRETGYCKGIGGSMHIADQSRNFIGSMGIVAGGIPIAVGAAFASRYKKSNQIAICFFGDGAVHQGAFHEGLEFASKFESPVLFICENNLYAESTAVEYHLIHESVINYAQGYGLKSAKIDGNDLERVHEVSQEFIEWVRRNQKPAFIEFMTYKMSGQYEGDKQTYKPTDEIAYWAGRDPLVLLANKMMIEYKVDPNLFLKIESENKELVQTAFNAANNDPYPSIDVMRDAVYAETL
jgi:acetoin:2,6-dichlorophenolindophenol oxidoreductase subunit alpha